ncbi:hypothetical protein LEP1GSC179_2657 [Leptospira santarosai str. MOR084]|uniref:Uncharacterized protein n=1 Tax=Leptospira santarosai str. MOR084 TaxID=1049984 RepID=A0A0E2BDN1_9LEPT|nr:hypothetical protein LEP1GSC179_2657 [Leptospira santarosai str. MOR084]
MFIFASDVGEQAWNKNIKKRIKNWIIGFLNTQYTFYSSTKKVQRFFQWKFWRE